MEKIKSTIRDIPDFPKEGIVYKDITPVLKDSVLVKEAVKEMCSPYKESKVDLVVGVESRGFIFGGAMALELGAAFVPARKVGKLPYDTVSETYELEYGQDTLEMHKDAVAKGDKVLIVDDLLATGGTINSVKKLVEQLGGEIVGFSFLVELEFLKGRDKISSSPIHSLVSYS